MARPVSPVALAAVLMVALASPARADDARPAEKPLVIVAPRQFHAALADFAAFKRKVLPTELVALEDALKTDGADDPERLKRFLFAAWKAGKLGHVLLVGDADVMPVRYMVLDRVTPAAFHYAFYPSDLYYSDLAKSDGAFDDWNANKEGFHARYFGEVRGEKNKKDPINFDAVDYRPDVPVGRWPVSTVAELKVVAAKSMAYEESVRAGTHPGLRRAALFHVGGWVDARGRMDRLADALPAGWKADRYFFAGGPRFKTPPPDEANLVGVLNAGAGLVVHAGHGTEDSWEGCFLPGSLAKLKNADRLPVLVSAGCSTAYFAPLAPYDGYVDADGKEHAGTDRRQVFTAPPPPPAPYQKGRFNPTGLGERLLKAGPDGAVAYIGCNTGSQPCGLTLVDGFVGAVGKAQRPRVGECWAAAVAYYHEKEGLAKLVPTDDWYPPSVFFQGMKFMLFGDPTLPLAGPAN